MENINKAVIKGDIVTDGMRRLWDGIRSNLDIKDLPGEVWVVAEGSMGFYEVSNFMRVRSVRRIVNANMGGIMEIEPRILKQGVSCGGGYWEVRFSFKCKRVNKRVHRLYTSAFYSNPFNKPVVNHKNLIKTDNIPCNLELVTVYENTLHAKTNGAIPCGEAVKHSKLKSNQVLDIFTSKETYKYLAERYSVCEYTIHKIKSGKDWSSITGKTYNKNGLNK